MVHTTEYSTVTDASSFFTVSIINLRSTVARPGSKHARVSPSSKTRCCATSGIQSYPPIADIQGLLSFPVFKRLKTKIFAGVAALYWAAFAPLAFAPSCLLPKHMYAHGTDSTKCICNYSQDMSNKKPNGRLVFFFQVVQCQQLLESLLLAFAFPTVTHAHHPVCRQAHAATPC